MSEHLHLHLTLTLITLILGSAINVLYLLPAGMMSTPPLHVPASRFTDRLLVLVGPEEDHFVQIGEGSRTAICVTTSFERLNLNYYLRWVRMSVQNRCVFVSVAEVPT